MIVTISFSATADNRDALVAKLQEIIPDTLNFAGCRRIDFVESTESPGDLMLIEDWETAEHYETYKAWRRESGTSVLGGGLVDPDSLQTTYYLSLIHI